MNKDVQAIRCCEDRWRELFAVRQPFRDGIIRWNNKNLCDQYTTNTFFSEQELCRDDVQAAERYQKEHDLSFLQLMCRKPLKAELVQEFSLKEELVLTMQLKGESCHWKENALVQIKDVQYDDIEQELINFHLQQEAEALKQSDYAKRQILQDMEAAKKHPEYHWLAAYLHGEIAGICHVLSCAGCVEIDDLVVDESFRNQYVATTILKYAAEHFDGIKYLHADADGTSKQLYEKLGFTQVDLCWEYRKVWS